MTSSPEATGQEGQEQGWALTMRTNTAHYYRDGAALCGGAKYDGPGVAYGGRGRDDCPACDRQRRAEKKAQS